MTAPDLPDLPDEATVIRELVPLYEIDDPINASMPPRAWFTLIGTIQLMLRHPQLPESQIAPLKEIGHHIQALLAPVASANVNAWMAWGWNPQLDVDQQGKRVARNHRQHQEFDGSSDTTPLVEQLLADLGMEEEVRAKEVSGDIPPHLRTDFAYLVCEHPDIQPTLTPFEAFQTICALQAIVQQTDMGQFNLTGISLVTVAHRLTRELEMPEALYHFLQQRWAPELQDSDDDPLVPLRFWEGDDAE